MTEDLARKFCSATALAPKSFGGEERKKMVDHILLKFNATAGADPMPRIRELATELALSLEELKDEKHLRLVRVTGQSRDLFELAKRLRRLPAVTAKIG